MSFLCGATKLDLVKKHIQNYQDFPKPGVLFRDIFSVLRNNEAFQSLIDLLVEHVDKVPCLDAVVALESRGFLFGPILALHLKIPFVPIRKKGKLPGITKQVTYQLEYGSDIFEAQSDSIKEGQKVLLVDDLLATGGSLSASCKLMRMFGAEVAECLVVIELVDLGGRGNITAPVHSLLQF